MSAGDTERHQRAQRFAARIAQRLAEGLRTKRYQAVHLVAAPRLLGCLRSAIDGPVAAAVVGTLDKDVVQESNAALTRRLFGSKTD